MEATDFSNGQIWGILPDNLEILIRSYLDIRDRKDLPAEAARYIASGPSTEEKPYTMLNGAAVIPVNGTITKRASFMSMIYGGASAAGIIHSLKTAQADPEVKAVVLSIDSPGGTVSSVESLEEAVRNADAVKPVVAFGNGMMASAAYWIGSAARSVIVENTAQVGSIGVLMVHYDWSENDRKMGLKRTFVAAGRYKAMGNDAEPLSREARDEIEAQLNHYYSLFVDAVARNRKTDVQAVLEGMADGRVFIGKQAVDVGLADRTGNIEAAVNTALVFAAGSGSKGGISTKVERAVETSITGTEAGKTERQRIMGLAMHHLGEEDGKRFKILVESGVTVEQYATVRQATPTPAASAQTEEDRTMARMLAALKESRTEQGGKDFITLVAETVVATNCSRTEAMKQVIKANPEAHKAYLRKVNV